MHSMTDIHYPPLITITLIGLDTPTSKVKFVAVSVERYRNELSKHGVYAENSVKPFTHE